MIRIKSKKTALRRRDAPLTDNPCKCTLSDIDVLPSPEISQWLVTTLLRAGSVAVLSQLFSITKTIVFPPHYKIYLSLSDIEIMVI